MKDDPKNYIKPIKLPKGLKPDTIVIDADFVPYTASFSVAKKRYHFEDSTGQQVSQKFFTARKAKEWLAQESYDDFDEETIDLGYTRIATVTIGTEEEALAQVDAIVKKLRLTYPKSIKEEEFWITKQGTTKLKDTFTDSEFKYQFNREGVARPEHWQACRAYFESLPFVKTAPAHAEADNIVIIRGEKLGEKGVVISQDKDIGTMYKGLFVHLNKTYKDLYAKEMTTLGELWLDKNKVRGCGYKYLAVQISAGDICDGVKGIDGFGLKGAYNLFNELTNVNDVTEALVKLYEDTFPDGHKYTDWKGKPQHKTAQEMLHLDASFVYMERSSKDRYHATDYLTGGKHG